MKEWETLGAVATRSKCCSGARWRSPLVPESPAEMAAMMEAD